MRRLFTFTASAALVLASTVLAPAIGLSPANAAASIDQACTGTYAPSFNIAKAAKLKKPVKGKKKGAPIGVAGATSIANLAMADARTNPCSTPAFNDALANLDYINVDIAEGNADQARQALLDLVSGLDYRVVHKLTARDGALCEEFDSHGLQVPQDAIDALAASKMAQTAGWEDVSATAMAKAASIVSKWAATGAGGQATSITDWLGIVAKLQVLGAEDAADKAFAKVNELALDAYKAHSKLTCKMTKAEVDCFIKAATFVMLIGAEPATLTADLADANAAATALAQGKRTKCKPITYAFRMTFSSKGGGAGFTGLDTGRIVFTVQDGRITSDSHGPMELRGGHGQCWEKQDETWVNIGGMDVIGGSFRYDASGRDDADTLFLQLKQQAKFAGDPSGSEVCKAFAEFALRSMNQMFRGWESPGLQLPSGIKRSIDWQDVSTEIFEPTGETVVSTLSFSLKVLSKGA